MSYPAAHNAGWGRYAPLALAAMAFAVWLALLWVALQPTPPDWDEAIYSSMCAWRLPALTDFLQAVTWLGNTKVAAVYIVATFMGLVAFRRLRLAAVFALGGILDLINSTALQAVIGRPRPDQLVHPGTDSFPSGHAFNAVLFLGLMVAGLVLPKVRDRRLRWGIIGLWMAFVVATGLSRVHLGHHMPTDVLGGFLLGALALAFLLWLRTRLGWR